MFVRLADPGALKAHHETCFEKHTAMVSHVLGEAADIVNANVYLHPGFKPITHQTQDATKTKVVRARNGRVLRVTNAGKRARWLEEGTQPHWIFPHKKKVLRFRGRGGNWVSTKVVKHPGTKPYWFLRNATQRAGDRVPVLLEIGMSGISRSFGN